MHSSPVAVVLFSEAMTFFALLLAGVYGRSVMSAAWLIAWPAGHALETAFLPWGFAEEPGADFYLAVPPITLALGVTVGLTLRGQVANTLQARRLERTRAAAFGVGVVFTVATAVAAIAATEGHSIPEIVASTTLVVIGELLGAIVYLSLQPPDPQHLGDKGLGVVGGRWALARSPLLAGVLLYRSMLLWAVGLVAGLLILVRLGPLWRRFPSRAFLSSDNSKDVSLTDARLTLGTAAVLLCGGALLGRAATVAEDNLGVHPSEHGLVLLYGLLAGCVAVLFVAFGAGIADDDVRDGADRIEHPRGRRRGVWSGLAVTGSISLALALAAVVQPLPHGYLWMSAFTGAALLPTLLRLGSVVSPSPTVRRPEKRSVLDPELERMTGVELFNFVWTLLEKPDRSPGDDVLMVHAAHASRLHWERPGAPVNHARGEWQISRVYAVLGRAEPALHHATRCLELCEAHAIGDFDLAYAYEALARAHGAAGSNDEAARFAALAREQSERVADPDDREHLLEDLGTLA